MSLAPSNGGSAITDGRKVVTTAGTRVAVVAAVTPVFEVDITAETDNTGLIIVGSSSVVASLSTRRGTPLNAGDTITLHDIDLSTVYLDSTVSTDGVTYSYVAGV